MSVRSIVLATSLALNALVVVLLVAQHHERLDAETQQARQIVQAVMESANVKQQQQQTFLHNSDDINFNEIVRQAKASPAAQNDGEHWYWGKERAFPFPKPKVDNPEAYLNSTAYLQYFGYPYEQHFIVTEDGYVLRFYRLQARGQAKLKRGLKPVYLQHGLLDNSDTFFVNWKEKAPAFMLADAGYDVWLGNSRGNFQSMMHVNLSPKRDPEFWQFTFQNMSRYDLPAAFQYICNATGFDKIDYIGHSQGSMIMFIALAENNRAVKDRLKHFIAWGPVIYVENITSNVFIGLAHSNFLPYLQEHNINNVLSYNWFYHPVMIEFCNYAPDVCRSALGPIADADPRLDNASRMDVLVGHDPGGTSLWNLQHWQQEVLKGGWNMFDYGSPEANQFHYGQTTPPQWDPKKIDVPVYLMAGTTDRLADPVDVAHMIEDLTHSQVWFKNYNSGHLTFVWGNDVPQMPDVFAILAQN